MTLTWSILLVLTIGAFFSGYLISSWLFQFPTPNASILSTNGQGSRLLRSLAQVEDQDDVDVYKGSVTVDFYRTKKVTENGSTTQYSYSIPEWRLTRQLQSLSQWFAGRVDFVMGDICDLDDPLYINTPFICDDVLATFATSSFLDKTHISVLYVEQLMGGSGHGCATRNTLLGGDNSTGQSPAMILGMSNTRPLWFSETLGAAHWGGTSIAFHTGLIMGLLPTGTPEEGVAVYNNDACQLSIRYPQFSSYFEGVIIDSTTGQEYNFNDWKGKYNIMNPLEGSKDFFRIISPWRIGLFRDDYAPFFDSIVECWFSRSAPAMVGVIDDNHT